MKNENQISQGHSSHSHPNGSIRVVLNGSEVTTRKDATLVELLKGEGIDPERNGIAVAMNDQLVRRGEWGNTILGQDDRVEVITALQGG